MTFCCWSAFKEQFIHSFLLDAPHEEYLSIVQYNKNGSVERQPTESRSLTTEIVVAMKNSEFGWALFDRICEYDKSTHCGTIGTNQSSRMCKHHQKADTKQSTIWQDISHQADGWRRFWGDSAALFSEEFSRHLKCRPRWRPLACYQPQKKIWRMWSEREVMAYAVMANAFQMAVDKWRTLW